MNSFHSPRTYSVGTGQDPSALAHLSAMPVIKLKEKNNNAELSL